MKSLVSTCDLENAQFVLLEKWKHLAKTSWSVAELAFQYSMSESEAQIQNQYGKLLSAEEHLRYTLFSPLSSLIFPFYY